MDRNVITREQQLQAGFATPSAFNETLTSAENQTLTSMAQNAGIEEPVTTPTIDVGTIQTPQTSVVESPAEITGGTINSLENQIRAIAGIDTTAEIDNTESILQAIGEDTANLQRELGNQPREQARLEEEAGLPELRKQQRDITAQMSALQAQLTADIETITEKGRAEGSLAFASSGERARRTRQAAAEMAGLSAINQAIQGNIATAQEYVTQAMDIKYSALEGELNAQQTLLQLNQDKMTRQEKRLAEKKQTEISLLQSRLEQQRNNESEARMSIITAMGNGLSSGVGSELMSKLSKGEISPSSVFATTGSFLVDPLDRALKAANLRAKNLEIEEYESTQQVLDSEWGTVIETAASLVGSERGKDTRRNMASAIKNGDYKTAYSYAANNIEEFLTGENATKFGAQRNDYKALAGLREAVQDYVDAGGDTGLLIGKAEEIQNKLLGVTTNPELTSLATQLSREFQAYRTQATGAAFSPEESRDYEKVNPSTKKNLDLNLSIIDGAMNQINNRIISTTESRIPGAEILWELSKGTNTSNYLDTIDSSLQSDDLDDFLKSLNVANSTSQ